MVEQLVDDDDPSITQASRSSQHTSLLRTAGRRTGTTSSKAFQVGDHTCTDAYDSSANTRGSTTSDSCSSSDNESTCSSSDHPCSVLHGEDIIHDGMSSNLDRRHMLEPIVLAAYAPHSSMVNFVCKTPVYSSSLDTTMQDDSTSVSYTHLTLPTILRV